MSRPTFPIRAFAKMARVSNLSRLQAESVIQDRAPDILIQGALDEAYSEDPERLKRIFNTAIDEAVWSLASSGYKDPTGLDILGPVVLSILFAIEEESSEGCEDRIESEEV